MTVFQSIEGHVPAPFHSAAEHNSKTSRTGCQVLCVPVFVCVCAFARASGLIVSPLGRSRPDQLFPLICSFNASLSSSVSRPPAPQEHNAKGAISLTQQPPPDPHSARLRRRSPKGPRAGSSPSLSKRSLLTRRDEKKERGTFLVFQLLIAGSSLIHCARPGSPQFT